MKQLKVWWNNQSTSFKLVAGVAAFAVAIAIFQGITGA
jgi:hypothetical protein